MGLYCEHQWEFVRDWEGDDTIPNGTRDCSYYQCTECDAQQDEEPSGFEDAQADYGDYLYDQAKDARALGELE